MLSLSFATQTNFLDPTLTSDGQYYGPIRYKEIVRDLVILAKNLNTPYNDLLMITPRERDYMKEFLNQSIEETKAELAKRNSGG